jgi:hypothetical protein
MGLNASGGQQMQFEVLFNCNMEVQILTQAFDPAADTLDVRGSFNGWAGPNDILAPNLLNPDLYQAVVFDSLVPVTDTVFYKYVVTTSGGQTVWENVSINPIGGNRWFNTTGNEPDLNGNGIPDVLLDTVFFSDVGADDIFTTQEDIVFEADMRPAYRFLADSGFIAFPEGTVDTIFTIDSVYFAGNNPTGPLLTDPELLWVWDFQNDPRIENLKLNDDGQDGDLVAGDSVWSITITFFPGAAKVLTWKHGIGPYDNEAGFAENHQEDVSAFGGRVRKQFGENGAGPGQSNWYVFYLGIEPGEDFFNLPESYMLSQNYPNPFNPSTTISYAINRRVDVVLEIYNILGQKVRTLVNQTQTPGIYNVTWNGTNDLGLAVGSGVYLYKFTAGNNTETRKMMLMK